MLLVNRAQSILRALSACNASEATQVPCPDCPVARVDPETGRDPAGKDCRAYFRVTLQRLADLADRVPRAERLQMRRTVDGLHLAYRQIDGSGKG